MTNIREQSTILRNEESKDIDNINENSIANDKNQYTPGTLTSGTLTSRTDSLQSPRVDPLGRASVHSKYSIVHSSSLNDN